MFLSCNFSSRTVVSWMCACTCRDVSACSAFVVEMWSVETASLWIFVSLKEHLAHRSAPLSACVCALTANTLLRVCRRRAPLRAPPPSITSCHAYTHTHSEQSRALLEHLTNEMFVLAAEGDMTAPTRVQLLVRGSSLSAENVRRVQLTLCKELKTSRWFLGERLWVVTSLCILITQT